MQQKMGLSGAVPEGRRAPRGATVPCRLRDMVNLNRRLVMGEDGRRNPRTENLGLYLILLEAIFTMACIP